MCHVHTLDVLDTYGKRSWVSQSSAPSSYDLAARLRVSKRIAEDLEGCRAITQHSSDRWRHPRRPRRLPRQLCRHDAASCLAAGRRPRRTCTASRCTNPACRCI